MFGQRRVIGIPDGVAGIGRLVEATCPFLVFLAAKIGQHFHTVVHDTKADAFGHELAQRFDRFQGNGVLVDLLALLCGGGQIEQDDRYAGVDAVGCDLGAHDASAQHGHFTDRLIG